MFIAYLGVFGNSQDRVNMTLPDVQQGLYTAVAAAAKKLIVVLVSAGLGHLFPLADPCLLHQ